MTLVMSIITQLSTIKAKYYLWKCFVMLSSKKLFLVSIRSDAIITQLVKTYFTNRSVSLCSTDAAL